MFGQARGGISAYQKVGVDAAVEVADPHKLILLLFAGAQAAIGQARAAMQLNQIAEKGTAISRAIDIINNGLNLMGASNDIQYIVIGAVIILVVTIDVFRNKAEARARKMAAQ